jgi:hypothetical protein
MDNNARIRSEFVYNIPRRQMESLIELAVATDRPMLELLMEAIDQYIEREVPSCQQ